MLNFNYLNNLHFLNRKIGVLSSTTINSYAYSIKSMLYSITLFRDMTEAPSLSVLSLTIWISFGNVPQTLIAALVHDLIQL